jgi:Protein of unknown function (DUF4242)
VQTYLVEHYHPGYDAEALKQAAARARAAGDGSSVRHLRSTIVPADEAFLCVFEAASDTAVREAYARGGITFQRISLALQEESS